jgi:hypothetical protein
VQTDEFCDLQGAKSVRFLREVADAYFGGERRTGPRLVPSRRIDVPWDTHDPSLLLFSLGDVFRVLHHWPYGIHQLYSGELSALAQTRACA